MYRLLENHGKKILIFVGVGLMIVFILPPQALTGGGSRADVGELPDGTTLTGGDMVNAEARLRRLNALIIPVSETNGVPAIVTLFPTVPQELQRQRLNEFTSDPLLLQLALIEAEQRGVYPTQEMIDSTLEQDVLRFNDGTGLLAYNQTNNETGPIFRAAVADLLSLQNLRAVLASGSLQISKPLRESQAVLTAVQLTTDYHLIDAEPFLAEVAEPTDEQLQTFFKEYAEQNPGQVTDENPFGVGYRLQPRVKVQYFQISRAAVEEVVKATKDDYEWSKEAIKLYQADRNSWASDVLEATQDAEAEGPAQAEAPDLSETDFADLPESVQTLITEAAVTPLVNDRLRKIVDYLRNTMVADAQTNRVAESGGDVKTIQNLPSFEYLQNLAAEAEKRFGVRPAVTSLADRFRNADELQRLDGVGGTFAGNFPQITTFAQMAILNEVILKDTPNEGNGMPLLTPSIPLQDLSGGDTYIFRVTDAAKSEPGTELEPVREKVAEDWKKTQALLAAVEKAEELAEAGFPDVEVNTAEQVSVYAPVSLEGISEEKAADSESAFPANLILMWGRGKVAGGIALPNAMTAAAVKVTQVNTIYENENAKAGLLRRADDQLRRNMLSGSSSEGFDATWLTKEALTTRTGFIDKSRSEEEDSDQ